MTTWTNVCPLTDLVPDTGVCALVEGKQVAVFRFGTGSIGERPVVASPLYKQHFDLNTGECLEDADVSVEHFPVRIDNGVVQVSASA